MLDGAVGLSTALQYPPAPYARTDELVALATEAAKYGGTYATHMRSEGDRIFQAIDEAITIGREAGIPVEIWHLKTAGKNNWGRMPKIVARIDSARRAGVDIAADTYAYPAWFNSMSAFVPPWALDGGTAKLIERLRIRPPAAAFGSEMLTPSDAWDNEWQEIPGPESVLISVVQNPALLQYQGKTLAEVARLRKKDAIETLLDILAEDQAYTYVAVFGMSEPDIALAHEAAVDLGGQRLAGDVARRSPRQGAPAPPRVRDVSPDPQEVRARGAAADSGGGDPEIHLAARGPDAAGRPRRAQGGDVGGRRGVRSGQRPRQGDVCRAEPARGGDGVGAGERRAGDRGWEGDGGAARTGAAGAGRAAPLARGPSPPILSPMAVDVTSEIGPLESVLVHTPGHELEAVTPGNREDYLYDDIIDLKIAQREHRQFVSVLRRFARVHEVRDLLAEILSQPDARDFLISKTMDVVPDDELSKRLSTYPPAQIVEMLIEGTREESGPISRALNEEGFAFPPLPNLFFPRDIGMVIGQHAVVGSMRYGVRWTEELLVKALFLFHPELANAGFLYDGSEERRSNYTLEGGDVHYLRPDLLVLGLSERSSPAALDALCDMVFARGQVTDVIVVVMPKAPTAIHLDMVFSQVDRELCVVSPPFFMGPERRAVLHRRKGEDGVRERPDLFTALRDVGLVLEPIMAGGDHRTSQEREHPCGQANAYQEHERN